MNFDNEMENMGEDMKDTYAEGKKDVKNAWSDTKNAAERAKNEVESEIDKM